MGNIEEFKTFVRKNPSLIKYVKNNQMTWQKFYEIYNLYGEDESAWNDYRSTRSNEPEQLLASGVALSGFLNWLKAINLDAVQEGVSSIQRVVGVLGDLSSKDTKVTPKEEYKPRPLYKHFDD